MNVPILKPVIKDSSDKNKQAEVEQTNSQTDKTNSQIDKANSQTDKANSQTDKAIPSKETQEQVPIKIVKPEPEPEQEQLSDEGNSLCKNVSLLLTCCVRK